jgi:PTS system mannose-specific IIB component
LLSLVRVDNRLIHGQVVEAWLPHLKAQRVAVADDEAAGSMLVKAAMGIAVGELDVLIQPVADVDYAALSEDGKRTVVLFRDVAGVWAARAKGLAFTRLNLGNVHFSTGRRRISSSVYLSEGELEQLGELSRGGVDVEAQTVPSEKPIPYDEMVERFRKG